MAVVARGFLVGHLLGAHLIQTLGAAEAREGMAFGDQFVRTPLVDLAALALPVRTVRATDVGAFVPLDTEPAQCVVELAFGFAGRAQLAGVLDAQDELAAMLAGEAEVEQRDVGGTDMGVAGRGRRDTGADGGHVGLESRPRKNTATGGWAGRMRKGAMLAGGPLPAPPAGASVTACGCIRSGRSASRRFLNATEFSRL